MVSVHLIHLLLNYIKFSDGSTQFILHDTFWSMYILLWQHFREKKLKEDHYLVPYALLELAMLFLHSNNIEEASNILDKSK